MKTYIFPYNVSFGKLDNLPVKIEIALSDKNAKRLERSAKNGGHVRLDEDEDIQDIYDHVYERVIADEKNQLLLNPTIVKDAMSWQDNYDVNTLVTDEQIDTYLDELEIVIYYPESLQLLDRSVRKKNSQSNYESVTIERDHVQEYLMVPGNAEKIVYVDDGKTLYHIPKKYSGKFHLPSGVERIEKSTFLKHTKITEIVLEDGIQDLPECAFDGCSSLKKIIIPSSLKTIGFNTFNNCSALSEVVFSEGLIEIDSTAFRFCSNLEKLILPSTVNVINKYINSYWNGIKDIYFLGSETTVEDKKGGDWSRMTMHVKAKSRAEQYARENNVKYIVEDRWPEII